MARGDASAVKVAIARLLRGPEFFAALTALVIEKGDGVWPVYPFTVFEEERLSSNIYPSAELIAYRSMYRGEIVKEAVHTIGIRWTCVAHDEQTVTKHVERLVGATTDVLWNSTLDTISQSAPIDVREEDYSPMVPTLEHPFVKSGLIMADVTTWRS